MRDTIAAIATATGGGVGMVRLSGPQALAVAGRVFRPMNPAKSPETMPGYTGAFGRVCHGEQLLDEAVLFVYHAPHSYTGEDVAEFCCHGGEFVLSQVLGGFLAGMGGGIEMLGRYPTFSWSSLPGYGWTGITIAILAGNNPWFVPFAAFFMAYLTKGCELMATYANVPSQLIDIIQGVIFLFFAAEQFLSKYRQKLVVKTAQEELAAKAALEEQKGGAEHA